MVDSTTGPLFGTRSQVPSLIESFASQDNSQSTSKDASQSSIEQQLAAAAATPPSPRSSFAPQVERSDLAKRIHGSRTSHSDLQVPTSSPQASNGQLYRVDTSVGQKRTSSGHVKTPSSSVSISPIDGAVRGHSRQTSSTSVISEVCILRLIYQHLLM